MQVTAITKMYTLYGNGLSASLTSLTISSSRCSSSSLHKAHADLTSASRIFIPLHTPQLSHSLFVVDAEEWCTLNVATGSIVIVSRVVSKPRRRVVKGGSLVAACGHD